MQLEKLKPNLGSKHRKKRLGCGESSGHGKTSGRGGKGQSARSGSSIRIGFEGGQMPLIRRLPKHGFNNARFKRSFHPVNIDELNVFPDDAVVDNVALVSAGVVKRSAGIVKLLAKGILTKRLTVKLQSFSAAAKIAVESMNGTVEVVGL